MPCLGSRGTCQDTRRSCQSLLLSPLPKTPNIIYVWPQGQLGLQTLLNLPKPCSPVSTSRAALVSPQLGDTNPSAPPGTGLSPTASTSTSPGFLLPLSKSKRDFPCASTSGATCCPPQPRLARRCRGPRTMPALCPSTGPSGDCGSGREPREASPAQLQDMFCAFKSHPANFGSSLEGS